MCAVEIQSEGCMYVCVPVCLCVCRGTLKDFLLCVSSVFFNSVGRRAKGKLIFLGKEG